MRLKIFTFFLALIAFVLGILLSQRIKNLYFKFFPKTQNPPIINIIQKPLEKYSILKMSETLVEPVEINLEKLISDEKEFNSHIFSVYFDPTLRKNNTKKMSGVINIPNTQEKMPVVLLLRGYIDQKIYKSGMGSQRVGEYLARNGYITVAPDFLGYADSDREAENIFESRFQTYTTALTILESVKSIPQWDKENIFIWGHSNGGQIALTILEVTKKEIPTVLWAPVSKPFPYSILYYTDESEDLGKLIRKELSLFEQNYNVNQYSIHNYFERIEAPLQIHQGTSDNAVPFDWTDKLVEKLNNLKKEVEYFKYQKADHNLQPNWTLAVQRSLNFYDSFLKN